MSSVFGPQVTPNDVERAVENTIRTWYDTYLREAERHEGFKPRSLPGIKSLRAADTMEQRFPEQQIPACQVMLTTSNKVHVQGVTGAMAFSGTVDVLVQSTEPEPARRLASLYAWYMGLMLEQNGQLDGSLPIAGFGWDEHGVPALGKPTERWLALGSIDVAFLVQTAFDPLAGPAEPGDEPPARPVVEKTEVVLQPEPANSETLEQATEQAGVREEP